MSVAKAFGVNTLTASLPGVKYERDHNVHSLYT